MRAADFPGGDTHWPPKRVSRMGRLAVRHLEVLRKAAIAADRARGRVPPFGLRSVGFGPEEEALYVAAVAFVLQDTREAQERARQGDPRYANVNRYTSTNNFVRLLHNGGGAHAYLPDVTIDCFLRALHATTEKDESLAWASAVAGRFGGTSDPILFEGANGEISARQQARRREKYRTFHYADMVFVPLNHDWHWSLFVVWPKQRDAAGTPRAAWYNSMIGCGSNIIPARAARRVAADAVSDAYLQFARIERTDPLVAGLVQLSASTATMEPNASFPQQPDTFNCGVMLLCAASHLVFRQGPLHHASIDVTQLAQIRKRIFVDCLLGYCR